MEMQSKTRVELRLKVKILFKMSNWEKDSCWSRKKNRLITLGHHTSDLGRYNDSQASVTGVATAWTATAGNILSCVLVAELPCFGLKVSAMLVHQRSDTRTVYFYALYFVLNLDNHN